MRALLDTSVLISGNLQLDSTFELAVASLSYAELQFGVSLPHLTAQQRAFRKTQLMRIMQRFGSGLPFDDSAATSYGIITEAVIRANQQVRHRAVDLLIASIAHSQGAALVTENGSDFSCLTMIMGVLKPDGHAWVYPQT